MCLLGAQGLAVTCSVSAPALAADDSWCWPMLDAVDAITSGGQWQLAMPLLLTLASKGKFSMDALEDLIFTNPARVFGITLPTETVIEVDLQTPRELPCGSGTIKTVGAVDRVTCNSELAFLDGKLVAKQGDGALLTAELRRPTASGVPAPSMATVPVTAIGAVPTTAATVAHSLVPRQRRMSQSQV
jgi:hypothetical protein